MCDRAIGCERHHAGIADHNDGRVHERRRTNGDLDIIEQTNVYEHKRQLARGHSLSRIIDRELSAGTEEEMREWVRWIRAAIAHSNNTGDAPGPDEELALEPQGCAIQ